MRKLIVAIACCLLLAGCVSEEKWQQGRQKAQELKTKLQQGDLIELRDHDGTKTHIVAFEAVTMGYMTEPLVHYGRYTMMIHSMPLAEFEQQIVRIIPKDSPEFTAAAHRYFKEK